METLLSKSPVWAPILVTVILSCGIAGLVHFILRWKYRHETLEKNNEVAGFNYAVLGVIYSVLLAFMTLAVYEEYKEGRNVLRHEAGTIINLHQMAEGLPEPARSRIQDRLIAYADSVVKDEWSLMGNGTESQKTRSIMGEIRSIFVLEVPESAKNMPLYTLSLAKLDDLQDIRHQRILSSQTVIPGFMWFVLVAGAVITVSFTFFFGAPNFSAQVMMTAMLAVLVVLILLLIVHLDNPFLGPVSLEADPYLRALRDMRGM